MTSGRVRIVFLIGAVFLVMVGCPRRHEQPSQSTSPQATTTPCSTGAAVDLDCAAFPNTDTDKQPSWDHFAWNTFIAANWPAVDPATHNHQRGIPDLNKTFTGAEPDALLTWETYKEKREVFYPTGNSTSPGVWNQAPQYGPVGTQVPMCGGSAAAANPPSRVFLQGGKMPIPFDSLDETVEVPSEAIESTDVLCKGVANPACNTPNEADCCRVIGRPVSPRVWKGQPSDQRPVIYEVKVNYDFFQYVTTNSLYLDQTAANAAQVGGIDLPYRTSAAADPAASLSATATDTTGTKSMSPTLPTPQPVFNYSAAAAMQGYKNVTPTSQVTPALSGAVHLKAAWILLKDEDKSKFHTTEAAYFKTDTNGKTCMAVGTFGLVGLHIIQRIHRGSGATAHLQGDTFVYATFEHRGNDRAGFTYSNHYGGSAIPPANGFYPALGAAQPVRRKFEILAGTQAVNKAVHDAIYKRDPNSVWLNYHLIGTQFEALNVPASPPAHENDPTGIGQPFFLANSVIETNDGLQKFQGLPPGEKPISVFTTPANTRIKANPSPFKFDRTLSNVSFEGQGYNMGGCMGCHGVAQLRGYSFSFVLFLGQRGAAIDTQMNFPDPAQPPPGQQPPAQTTTGQKKSG